MTLFTPAEGCLPVDTVMLARMMIEVKEVRESGGLSEYGEALRLKEKLEEICGAKR